MLDFGAGELVVIGVVALVAIGPKELPGLLRTVGQAVGRLRRMAGDFQNQFNDAMREADMAEAQKLISDIKTDISGDLNAAAAELSVPSMTASSMRPVTVSMPVLPEPNLVGDVVAPPEPVADLAVQPTPLSDEKNSSSDLSQAPNSESQPVIEEGVSQERAEEAPVKPKRKRTKKQDAEPQEGAS